MPPHLLAPVLVQPRRFFSLRTLLTFLPVSTFHVRRFSHPLSSPPSADILITNIIHLMPLLVLGLLGIHDHITYLFGFGHPWNWANQRPLILLVNHHPFSPPFTQSVSSFVFSSLSHVLSLFLIFRFSICLSGPILCSTYKLVSWQLPYNLCISMSAIHHT